MVEGSGTDEGPIGTTLPNLSYSSPPLKPGPLLGEGQIFSIRLVSIVTAPLRANARPLLILAAVFRVMLWSVRILPSKEPRRSTQNSKTLRGTQD